MVEENPHIGLCCPDDACDTEDESITPPPYSPFSVTEDGVPPDSVSDVGSTDQSVCDDDMTSRQNVHQV